VSRVTRPRRGGGHARRPRQPLRRRIGSGLPARGRLLALFGFALLIAGAVTLVNGPWLRVSSVVHAGARYTPASQLDGIMAPYQGMPLLTVDSEALRQQVAALPAVASARVEAALPGSLRVSVIEKPAAFVWRTPLAQLVVAADGTLMASLAATASLPAELRRLPAIYDSRYASRYMALGEALPSADMRVAARLVNLDPEIVGSRTSRLEVGIGDRYGFTLSAPLPDWEAALGFYEIDPADDRATADARLEAQLGAIRTLFAQRPESGVSWMDVRNPGKVYWTP
jgi:cell division septal protein FtsQ